MAMKETSDGKMPTLAYLMATKTQAKLIILQALVIWPDTLPTANQ